MNFIHHDLGQCSSGEVVEITLSGSSANVRLLDSTKTSTATETDDSTATMAA